MAGDHVVSFRFGPAWARDTGCCGKPAGCTNTSPGYLLRNHPRKRRHAQGPAETAEPAAAELSDPPAKVTT